MLNYPLKKKILPNQKKTNTKLDGKSIYANRGMTLEKDLSDANTYYLLAILGARTNNDQMITTNLRQAAKLDKSVIERAKSDLEFANFNLGSIFTGHRTKCIM